MLKTDYEPELIAQIFGGEGESLLQCALDIEKKYQFAGIEINMGCPSPKIMKCAAGS
ncbi:MAG: tRNA-dihydrouridine synthase [Candidatus Peribacteria bacterium]|nr:MAG: tRNA-dihydrouridine synthase [Candidatus Peribacteria bacterium]